MAEEDETATARYIAGHVSTKLMLKMMLEIITTIMTVPANTLLVAIQDRIPTILKRAGIPDWMGVEEYTRDVLKACSSGLSDMRTFVLIVEKLTSTGVNSWTFRTQSILNVSPKLFTQRETLVAPP
ncbi:hypothetical protein [Bradyrhizobium sp. dw_78]|uniref:hypothetical protein n=1 Tax=Bradyrhizobium sp. dw_78 TaxID=2719793 RepID=UPI001BD5EB3C|nr:hypothetical protein [Bradyrhizobium sp. dw_78]